MIDTKNLSPGDWIWHESGVLIQVKEVEHETDKCYASVSVFTLNDSFPGRQHYDTRVIRCLWQDEFVHWKKVLFTLEES